MSDRIPPAIYRYFGEKVFGAGTAHSLPPNFAGLESEPSAIQRVDGCPVPGQNIVTLQILIGDGSIKDIRARCDRCDPYMLVAANLLVEWARGRSTSEVTMVEPARILREMSAPLGLLFRKPPAFTDRSNRLIAGLVQAIEGNSAMTAPLVSNGSAIEAAR